MKTYDEIVRGYEKKKRETLIDTIGVALTYTDELCVEAGALEQTGLLHELTEGVCGALPFVMIAVTEGTKVILKRKPGMTGLKDSAWRMAKTGVAMGIGGAVLAAGAPLWAGVPASIGVRTFMDRYRSSLMTDHRVQGRIDRLQELRQHLQKRGEPQKEPAAEPIGNVTQTVLPAEDTL